MSKWLSPTAATPPGTPPGLPHIRPVAMELCACGHGRDRHLLGTMMAVLPDAPPCSDCAPVRWCGGFRAADPGRGIFHVEYKDGGPASPLGPQGPGPNEANEPGWQGPTTEEWVRRIGGKDVPWIK